MIEPLKNALARVNEMLSDPSQIRRIVLSGRQRGAKPEILRVDIRPVDIKGVIHFQAISHDGKRDTAKNFLPHQFSLTKLMEEGFGNLLVETTGEELSLRITKSGEAQINIKTLAEKREPIDVSHDKKKVRYLSESELIFRELGISDHHGKLKASRSDKYIQVNEFLKIINHAISELELSDKIGKTKAIKLTDLGCGNAYLTFAAHQFLINKGISAKTVGVDSRLESRNRNQEIVKRTNLSDGISFVAEEIASYQNHDTDITVALHACDTATDDAITWAIESRSKIILVAPCCQHNIQSQMKRAPEPWNIAIKHGILKERIGDIITDAIRAQVLRILGYRTDVIEFVAGDHTQRNLMIRAIYTGASAQQRDFEELDELMTDWGIQSALVTRLHKAIAAQRKSALG